MYCSLLLEKDKISMPSLFNYKLIISSKDNFFFEGSSFISGDFMFLHVNEISAVVCFMRQ
jgi:hypothetical protein